jgi:hypothetical protein
MRSAVPSAFVLVCVIQSTVFAQQAVQPTKFTVSGLVSSQHGDEFHADPRGPYLDRPLGGVGPGFLLALDFPRGRMSIGTELSAGFLSTEQNGRISGFGSHSRLYEAILGVTVGTGTSADPVRLHAGAGLVVFGYTTQASDGGIGDPALIGGVDVGCCERHAAEFVTNFRYAFVVRGQRATLVGVGPNVFRVGAGVRLKLQK